MSVVLPSRRSLFGNLWYTEWETYSSNQTSVNWQTQRQTIYYCNYYNYTCEGWYTMTGPNSNIPVWTSICYWEGMTYIYFTYFQTYSYFYTDYNTHMTGDWTA